MVKCYIGAGDGLRKLNPLIEIGLSVEIRRLLKEGWKKINERKAKTWKNNGLQNRQGSNISRTKM